VTRVYSKISNIDLGAEDKYYETFFNY